MGLPSTITTGSDVFDDVSNISGSSVVYFAESPLSDLIGRPTLRVSQEKTKAGIQRTLVSIQVPIYNPAKGVYEGFEKIDCTYNRPETLDITAAAVTYGRMAALLAIPGVVTTLTKGLV